MTENVKPLNLLKSFFHHYEFLIGLNNGDKLKHMNKGRLLKGRARKLKGTGKKRKGNNLGDGISDDILLSKIVIKKLKVHLWISDANLRSSSSVI